MTGLCFLACALGVSAPALADVHDGAPAAEQAAEAATIDVISGYEPEPGSYVSVPEPSIVFGVGVLTLALGGGLLIRNKNQ